MANIVSNCESLECPNMLSGNTKALQQPSKIAYHFMRVEEAAAGAQSLQDQAGHLEQVVGVFKLDGVQKLLT